MGISYSKLVPADSFLGQYMQVMQEIETPEVYDFFCGLWLMSLAMRGCVVNRPRAPVHMNMYCILAAESGVTRKSTAVREATKVAREFLGEDAILIEAKTSPEQLEYTLYKMGVEHGYGHAAISISELVTFLGREKYNLSMPGLLTDLYDSPDIRRSPGTIQRGAFTLRKVFMSFLSASTPSWLVRAINPDVVEGGFTSRCLFVVEERPKRSIAWPSGHDSTSARQLSCGSRTLPLLRSTQARGAAVATLGGISINPVALSIFQKWYGSRTIHSDPFRSSFEAREDAHVLKVAGFLCANDASWLIAATHIKAAIKIIAECKLNGSRLFEGTGTRSKMLIGIDKLREKLIECGMDTTSQTRLYLACRHYLRADDVRILLEIMHELDMVQRFEVQHAGAGRPTTTWRGTKLLMNKDMMKTIMETYNG